MSDTDANVLENCRDVLIALYQEDFADVRHHQSQRETFTNIALIITGGILGIINFDSKFNKGDLPLCFLLIGVGSFGALFCAKEHELVAHSVSRYRKYRERLGQLFPDARLADLKREADEAHGMRWANRILKRIQLWYFWVLLHLSIAAGGLCLAVILLSAPASSLNAQDVATTRAEPKVKTSNPRNIRIGGAQESNPRFVAPVEHPLVLPENLPTHLKDQQRTRENP
jgi:hypothetical protein